MTKQWTYGWYDSDSRLQRGEAPVASYAEAVGAVKAAVGYTETGHATIAHPGKALVWSGGIVVGIVEAKQVETAEAV